MIHQVGANDARYKRYSSLDDDGICRVGEELTDQSIIINRGMPIEARDQPGGSIAELSILRRR